ncbi:Calcineurin-like phosphoesterase protein [Marine Group I thaumarchaeote SCGC AAA799-O18]|jgi:putative SbcD/Mre11-related phosphoesterase|nr:Calcineurin-like phosphoesterase protein [Marine Group I thaumarchaeote SCGC AAA799-O18]
MVQTRLIPNYPALMIDSQVKSLVVTDLHLGFEAKLSQNNIFLGKNTAVLESIKEIEKIIDKAKPDSLILLGDVKSGIKYITKIEWNDVPVFLEKIKKQISITLIPGNHDANIEKLIPEGISLATSKGIIVEDVLLTHGHTMPSENFSSVNKIIMGHVHPVFFQEESIINGERVWVTMKCEKQRIFPSKTGELEIIIMPTFNKHFYTIQKKFYKKSISPILDKIEVLEAKILTLDGTIIGNESLLPNVI